VGDPDLFFYLALPDGDFWLKRGEEERGGDEEEMGNTNCCQSKFANFGERRDREARERKKKKKKQKVR
jgi:hypothetical protein